MDGITTYKNNAIGTQSSGQVIVMLYDGAIKFLRQAIAAIEAQQDAEKGECINRAQAIITELNICLDMEAGGEIAQNLRKLYNFMSVHINEANTKRDPQRIRDVIACLSDLNEGWKAITA